MIVTTYNQHVRLLSSEPFGWFALPKVYSGLGADIVMESLHSSWVKTCNPLISPVILIAAS
jgi:hypothetical protein